MMFKRLYTHFLSVLSFFHRIVCFLVYYTGLYFIISRFFRGKALILCYHSVNHPENKDIYPDNIVSVDNFEKQIEYVSVHKRVVSLSSFMGYINKGQNFPPNLACITFDDGYRDFLEFAHPVLRKHAVPSTVFPVTCLLDEGNGKWDDHAASLINRMPNELFSLEGEGVPESYDLSTDTLRKACILDLHRHLSNLDPTSRVALMSTLETMSECPSQRVTLSWNDLTELSKDRLVSFGCHAHTHRNLARLPPEEALQDILRSKELIAEKLGRRCLHFSYPFGNVGSYNPEIKKMLRKIGFHSAVTTRRGLNRSASDPFEVRRIVVRDDSSYVFKCSLIGLTLQR